MSDDLHVPVMLEDTVRVLGPKKGEKYLDLTAGYGGHAKEIIKVIGDESLATLVDRDDFAVEHLKKKFPRARIIKSDFAGAIKLLAKEGNKFDIVLADLGVSSVQLDQPDRGFGFKNDSELDMRMDRSQYITAKEIINNYSKKHLVEILESYGDEPRAKRIVDLILENRPLNKTSELETLVAKVYPGYSKKNPATRTFQAIRIEVNNEVWQLKELLNNITGILEQSARLAIITFHSIEDGIVKKFFKENSGKYDGVVKDLKVLKSSDTIDIVRNLRSRSAILRSVIYENKHIKK
ncbi:MAG: 16S rRNA (cytosine(1402)-N(4))-methyltransferase RsmH [Candidatus Nomurabacteria bacterium]|nr:MAG: 16S rRNA (cytosine(1402)-N(4))-methyltransferase RsmH [Candidatus Nomurabacteria bacterium]HRV76407.1 16S rRNA (cytosine(1402)-N(4))-methyltransferase RsmH [Candidatus Saccharimonadales bacterium]